MAGHGSEPRIGIDRRVEPQSVLLVIRFGLEQMTLRGSHSINQLKALRRATCTGCACAIALLATLSTFDAGRPR